MFIYSASFLFIQLKLYSCIKEKDEMVIVQGIEDLSMSFFPPQIKLLFIFRERVTWKQVLLLGKGWVVNFGE